MDDDLSGKADRVSPKDWARLGDNRCGGKESNKCIATHIQINEDIHNSSKRNTKTNTYMYAYMYTYMYASRILKTRLKLL